MALNRTYGKKAVHCDSPRFRSAEFADGKAVVSLDNAEYGFNRLVGIEGFELCGSDGVFHPADVSVDGQMPAGHFVEGGSGTLGRALLLPQLPDRQPRQQLGTAVIPFRTDDFQPRP